MQRATTLGPKVLANLERGSPFKISLKDSSPSIQLSQYAELVLLWPDNSAQVLLFDKEDMIALEQFVQANKGK